jgi:ABC-type polar amino acid transport system ATPase subunit
MIKAINIGKSRDGHQIIHKASLQVEAGNICVLIGPSGSGKTTLLRALTLLEPPDEGAITVDDTSYLFGGSKRQPIVKPWPNVTAVFQQLFLWPHLTLSQNITMPLTAQKKEVDKRKLSRLIDMFDMSNFIDRYPNESSIGQRQRAALVRALMLSPKYLFLDEVTSALDVEQVGVVLECLKQLKSEGVGVLMITHMLRFAQKSADRVYFLDHGEIVEAGGPEVLQSPATDRMRSFLSAVLLAS